MITDLKYAETPALHCFSVTYKKLLNGPGLTPFLHPSYTCPCGAQLSYNLDINCTGNSLRVLLKEL